MANIKKPQYALARLYNFHTERPLELEIINISSMNNFNYTKWLLDKKIKYIIDDWLGDKCKALVEEVSGK